MEGISIWNYLLKVALGLSVIGLMAFGALRLSPRFRGIGGGGVVSVLSVTPVGRDLLYVLRVGPSVMAVISCPKGEFAVLDRWDWESWRAEVGEGASGGEA